MSRQLLIGGCRMVVALPRAMQMSKQPEQLNEIIRFSSTHTHDVLKCNQHSDNEMLRYTILKSDDDSSQLANLSTCESGILQYDEFGASGFKTKENNAEKVIYISPCINSRTSGESHVQEKSSSADPVWTEKIQAIPNILECKVQSCSELFKRDIRGLLRGIPDNSQLTAITLAQYTSNDMSAWSAAVQNERDALFGQFLRAAQFICGELKSHGYWADYIDPCSGTLSDNGTTNDTLFETDERYHHLGFSIEDLGCCKTISHEVFGTRVFVGSIFTRASPDEFDILGILKSFPSL